MTAQVVQCPRDPGVETALRCSRCESPICPRCLVHTPVGARCRDCARILKNPLYQLNSRQFALALASAVVGGVVMGLVWLFVLLPMGGFGLFFSLFLGVGLSWVFTKMMDVTTRRKRGPVVTTLACVGIALAWAVQLLFLPWAVVAPGLLAVGIGCYLAYQNLR